MKKQSANATGKMAIAVLASFVFLFSSYSKTYASKDSATNAAKFNAVTYQGLKDKSLVFKVDYKNEMAKPFQLVIKGEENETIYSKSFDAKPLNISILLNEVPENCKLTFEFQSPENNFSQSFQIDTKVTTVEEYVVKGL